MSRGGKRVPRNPAVVSLSGAASSRTDGSVSNPILDAPSPAYGAKVALQRQAAAAPMQQGAGGGAAAPMPPGPPQGGMFDPTQRPGEPITAGAATGPGPGSRHIPPDPDEALHVIYQMFPNDDLLALIEQRRRA